MKKVLLYYIKFVVLICSVNYLYAQDNKGYIVNVGDQAPDFIIDGENIMQENKGKVIMLQFTASWCSVCIREMPHIEEEVWQLHKDNDNFILLGLAKDTEKRPQTNKEIDFMVNKTGATYPIFRDKKSMIFNLFAEKKAGVTRNVIIDQNGKIQFLTRLFDIEEFNQMKLKIEELLK